MIRPSDALPLLAVPATGEPVEHGIRSAVRQRDRRIIESCFNDLTPGNRIKTPPVTPAPAVN